ncbi:ABC transporter, permease protein [Aeromicrobium marinum DSM 15272]|uniref:ABC transporter, permease protein n=1 Tax=Aeromicrobium marinum DSM 15272 TaxID=585531 RepID=E2S9Q4_9ACTN|nr:iron ABC transporter permease [Aeromicrobium marinum]EFQ83978.1 ABC transporter, permease protein [Aeromicrobium marinum DSM 15272]
MADTVWRGRTLSLVVRSLGLTAAVCASCLVIGMATAWATTRLRLPGGAAWLMLAALPLAVPSYVSAYGWLATFPGWSGFVPSWLILTAVSTPYVTLPVAAALRSADPAPAEVARSLGRGPTEAWRTATLPQLAPAAGAGTLLVALYVLSDFGAVSMFRFPVFTFAIQRQYESFIGRDSAVVLALMLAVIALTLVAGERRLRGRGERWRTGSGVRRPPEPIDPGRWAAPVMAGMFVLPVIALVVPVVALFRRLGEGTSRSLQWDELVAAVVGTVGVSAAAALVVLLLAIPIGALAARYRGRAVAAVETGGYTGHALPGIVVALSLVYFSLRIVPDLYQTTAVLVFAYAVLFLPKAIGATRGSISLVSPQLALTARSLGRGPVAAQRSTTWRLASPGIAAGALLVMLTAMKELPATLILRPTGYETLATEIWSRTNASAYGAAAPYALALLVLAALPAFWLSRPQAWEGPR